MNATPQEPDENSSWDLLASELGLEPAPTPAQPKAAPRPAAEPAPPVPEEPVAEEMPDEEPALTIETFPTEPVAEDSTEIITIAEVVAGTVLEDTVLEEGPEMLDEVEAAAEANAAPEGTPIGEGGGRKRRRRRRRKKGSGEPVGNPPPDIEDEITSEPVPQGEPEVIDETAEIVGDAAPEFEDEEDEEVTAPHAAIEELEEDSTEPLPEWKVMAWTDLLATLYRPQDR